MCREVYNPVPSYATDVRLTAPLQDQFTYFLEISTELNKLFPESYHSIMY